MARFTALKCVLIVSCLLTYDKSVLYDWRIFFVAISGVSCLSSSKEIISTKVVQLRGSGASFPASVYSSWISSYQAVRQQFVDLNMTYAALGSGEGLKTIRQYDTYGLQYVTSDVGLSKQEFRDNPDFRAFPTMAGAGCIVFNLPKSASTANDSQNQIKTLNLSREALLGIFNGTVTLWNDPLISLENLKLALPAQLIRVVVRRDNSGTTGMFTSTLTRFSPEWSKTYGKFTLSSGWNSTVISYYGVRNRGLAGIIMSFPYTIGYVSVADVVDMNLYYALLKNRAGYFIDPRDSRTLQFAMDDYAPLLDEHLMADISDGPGPLSYPFQGFTYMIFVANPARTNCDAAEEFLRYVQWFLNDDYADELCVKQNMIPLSQTIAKRVRDQVLRSYRCNGKSMWLQVEDRKAEEERSLQTWRLPVYILVPICSAAILGFVGYIVRTWQRQNRAVRHNLFIVPRQNIRLRSDAKPQQSGRLNSQYGSSNGAYSLASVEATGSRYTLQLSTAATTSIFSDENFLSSEYDQHQHQQRQQRKAAVIIHDDGSNSEDVELMKVVVLNSPQPHGDIAKLAYKTRRLLLLLRDKVAHVNVQRFIGLVTMDESGSNNNNDTLDELPPKDVVMSHYLVCDACSKGNMQALIHSNKYDIDGVIKFSLAIDIAAGMEYLHSKHNLVHGQLRTWSCLITSRWHVCISDWEWQQFEQNNTELRRPAPVDQRLNLLLYDGRWIAPEMLAQLIAQTTILNDQAASEATSTTSRPKLAKREVSPAFSSPSQKPHASGDVYSFAIILYEIFEREQPYSSYACDDSELIRDILHSSARPKWSVTSETVDKKEILKIRAMVESIWQSPADCRPNFQVLHKKLQQINPGGKSSLVDLMMKALDDYATSLEDRVMERTSELQQVTNNMTQLLHRMVPPSIADKLSKGESVLPEGYDSVSIYFSDVVGFTEICAASTPLEIVHLLNNLYTIFDETIDNHDVFKVETIGDSYMLISGLPNRNGIEHAGHIATVALKLLSVVLNYHIPHNQHKPLQIRSGVHSGSVMAGVVGIKMPRYCLFGDTVNTAARMESSSLPMRIQVSVDTKSLLDEICMGFQVKHRGRIDVKGKGEMDTFWLLDKPDLHLVLPAFNAGFDEVERQKLILSGQYK